MTELPCPPLSELLAEEPPAEAAAHAASCPRCAALVRSTNARVVAVDVLGEPDPETRRAPKAEPAPGAVVLVAADGIDGLLPAVVLALGEESVTVAPVSPEPELATEWDLLLPAALLGYAAVAQIWNLGSVLPEQLEDVIATVDPDTRSHLEALARATARGGEAPAGAAVGPAVLSDEDPRLLVQDEQATAARFFWEPALALAGSATLGEVVRHRRDELGVEPGDLQDLADTEGWLDALERDMVDLPRALPSGALAELMRRIGIGASRRLREVARTTIEAQAPALARGQSRAASAAENERYLDEFLTALEDR